MIIVIRKILIQGSCKVDCRTGNFVLRGISIILLNFNFTCDSESSNNYQMNQFEPYVFTVCVHHDHRLLKIIINKP